MGFICRWGYAFRVAIKELTEENFSEIISKNGIVIVDFWASWCKPCVAFAPIFEQAAEENPDIVFGKVDTQAQRAMAEGFQIVSIPTLIIFRDGIIVFNQPGAISEHSLNELIGVIRELDMDEIRLQLEDQTE